MAYPVNKVIDRRGFIRSAAAAVTASALASHGVPGAVGAPINSKPGSMITRPIPSSGEHIPAIGMGTWITFNVGADKDLRNQRTKVLQTFFDKGGAVVDCSPMYGSSADVLGYALERIENDDNLFAASKVWTWDKQDGPGQMRTQRRHWGIEQFDLMQVHNLLSRDAHLETLRRDKEEGKIRYIGVTTSHGRRHDEMEKVMQQEDLDFVQLTYNIIDRKAEQRLLPLARERGIAVIANRPFRQKALFFEYAHHPLPDWAAEFDCDNWAQFFLKFVISHPGVTCAIPATTRVDHMQENMGALYGRLPDAKMRERMVRYIENL